MLASNIINNFNDEKYKTIKKKNQRFNARIGKFPAAIEILS